MEVLNNGVETIKSLAVGVLNNTTENPVLYGVVAMFLAMYGPRLHPRLPPVVRNLFNNNMFRFAVILLVIYMSNKNLQMALVVAIGFLLVTSIATSLDIDEHFAKTREGYADYDAINEFYEEEFKVNTSNDEEDEDELEEDDEDEEDLEEDDEEEDEEELEDDEEEEEEDDEEEEVEKPKKKKSKSPDMLQQGLVKASELLAEAAGKKREDVEGMVSKLAGISSNKMVESFENYAPY